MGNQIIEVEQLGLTPKTAMMLREGGINTLDDLLLLDDKSIMSFGGLSRHRTMKVRECVEKWRAFQYHDVNVDLEEERNEQPAKQLAFGFAEEPIEQSACQSVEEPAKLVTYRTVGEYLTAYAGARKDQKWDRDVEVFVKYYADAGSILESVAQEYGVTRERVRQVCSKCLNAIKQGLENGLIDDALVEEIERAAEAKTETSMVNVSDGLLGREGVLNVITAIYRNKYEIVKSNKLNGQWLVKKDANVKNMIDYLSKTLQERDRPMLINEVLTIFSINEDMLFSVKNLVEKDGCVTLSTNKTVMGNVPKIKAYLLSIGRPASITEIAEGTGLTIGQVRGIVSDRNEFENVGKSIYDSADADYSDLSVGELARNILVAEDCGLTLERVIKYIQRYDESELNEKEIMIELFSGSDPVLHLVDGYALLKEWDAEKIQKPMRRGYEVELREAVSYVVLKMDSVFDAEDVLEEIKKTYGDKTSNNINSVRGYLNVLAKNDVLVEVGAGTGCYRRP